MHFLASEDLDRKGPGSHSAPATWWLSNLGPGASCSEPQFWPLGSGVFVQGHKWGVQA